MIEPLIEELFKPLTEEELEEREYGLFEQVYDFEQRVKNASPAQFDIELDRQNEKYPDVSWGWMAYVIREECDAPWFAGNIWWQRYMTWKKKHATATD